MNKIILFFASLAIIYTAISGCNKNQPSGPAGGATATPTADVSATISPTTTEVVYASPTASPTMDITPDAGSKLYTFNDATEMNWTMVNGGIASTEPSNTQVFSGAYSLTMSQVIDSTFDWGVVSRNFYYTPLDLRGKTFTMQVYAPNTLVATGATVSFVIRNSTASNWTVTAGQALSVTGWNTISIGLPTTADFGYVRYAGFKISAPGQTWTGLLYADEISW